MRLDGRRRLYLARSNDAVELGSSCTVSIFLCARALGLHKLLGLAGALATRRGWRRAKPGSLAFEPDMSAGA